MHGDLEQLQKERRGDLDKGAAESSTANDRPVPGDVARLKEVIDDADREIDRRGARIRELEAENDELKKQLAAVAALSRAQGTNSAR